MKVFYKDSKQRIEEYSYLIGNVFFKEFELVYLVAIPKNDELDFIWAKQESNPMPISDDQLKSQIEETNNIQYEENKLLIIQGVLKNKKNEIKRYSLDTLLAMQL